MDLDDLEETTFQQQALELCPLGADFDPSAVPQNGDEFLMRMAHERRQCPAVVVRRPKVCSGNAAETTPTHTEETAMTHNSLLPTAEWKLAQTADFLATRDRIGALRCELHTSRYDNALEPPLTTDADAWREFCRVQPPRLSTILRLNQRTLEQLLEWLCEWMRGNGDAVEGEDENESAAVQHEQLDLSCPAHWFVGAWLYATLACLHLPLEPDVHSTLRDIVRICLTQRGRLAAQQLEQAVPYNLFIHLISHAFGQLDFGGFV